MTIIIEGVFVTTLKDIAALSGVSVSTVSRIINSPNDSFARKEVRDKVWAAINETGYIPNQCARELKRGKSKVPAVPTRALACILGRTPNLEDNPFFAQVARAVEHRALELDYAIQLSYSVFDIGTDTVLQKIESAKVDGAVVLGRFNDSAIAFLEQHYKNIVYVGRNVLKVNWDQVICDGYEATQVALEHLIAYGHRRIGYIGETNNEIRYQAYCDMVTKHGLERDHNLVSHCPQNGAGGYQGAGRLIETANPLPTAVFCAADVAAIAALRRFAEAGIKVPEQITIISMDNIELSGYVSPMLTTVGMPIVEMGNVAVQTLIDRIQRRHRLPMKIFLPSELALRESVAKLNGKKGSSL